MGAVGGERRGRTAGRSTRARLRSRGYRARHGERADPRIARQQPRAPARGGRALDTGARARRRRGDARRWRHTHVPRRRAGARARRARPRDGGLGAARPPPRGRRSWPRGPPTLGAWERSRGRLRRPARASDDPRDGLGVPHDHRSPLAGVGTGRRVLWCSPRARFVPVSAGRSLSG